MHVLPFPDEVGGTSSPGRTASGRPRSVHRATCRQPQPRTCSHPCAGVSGALGRHCSNPCL